MTIVSLKFYENSNINEVDSPVYSPELNPIENECANIKSKLLEENFIRIKWLTNKNLGINILVVNCKNMWKNLDRIENYIEIKGRLKNY